MAKLYLGNVQIGGDVDQADLDDLDAKITVNTDAIDEIKNTDLPAIEGDISDLTGRVTIAESGIESLHEEIQIIGNASVVGAYVLVASGDPASGEMVFSPDAADWSGTTTIKMSKIDAANHTFTFGEVGVGDVIQAGSPNGKGLFEVTAVTDTSGTFGEFEVTVLTSSSGHVAGERVSVTVGSSYDETVILGLIADNTAAIGVEKGRIDALEPRMDQAEDDINDLETELSRVEGITSTNDQAITDLSAEVDGKFNIGAPGGPMAYGTAAEMDEAIVAAEGDIAKNAADILNLSTGGNPAVDELAYESVRNTNMKYDGVNPPSDDGVKNIEVTTNYNPLTADPYTLYVSL